MLGVGVRTLKNKDQLDVTCYFILLLRLLPATRAVLKTSRTKSPTHNEMRTKRPMW